MPVQRTAKAEQELQPGTRTLGLKERSVLLMANGRRTAAELSSVLDAQGAPVVQKLVAEGYLYEFGEGAATRQNAPAPALATAAPAERAAAPVATPRPASQSDTFGGKRSLATTRMFLFDLCERMFARRDPPAAASYRDELRDAKDAHAMLVVAGNMLAQIEKLAGSERAESIRERIAMLLPPELATAA